MAAIERELHGTCSCGRNTYVIGLPPNAPKAAQVVFDSKSAFQTSPLAAHLRVPLTWYHSTTHAFFPDETHPAIRRTYAPSSTSLRHFCGFCGSHLALWSEAPQGEAEYISLALGSLDRNDLQDLGELGLLPPGEQERRLDVPPSEDATATAAATRVEPRVGEGLPWFEAMIDGSALGRVKVRRGLEERDGRRVEWEVIEWTDGGEEEADTGRVEAIGGKRKLEQEG